MYFPYLYGRKNELLALRDVSADIQKLNITPVIEPAMAQPNGLVTCVQRLQDVGSSLDLIFNPSQGQFGAGIPGTWRQPIDELIAAADVVKPTFQIVSDADAAALPTFLQRFAGRSVGVVLRQPRISARDLASLLKGRDALVLVHTSANPRTYLRDLPTDLCVGVAASFDEQARNADFGDAEWFTADHLNFVTDGRPGFSDFGPLPTTFSLSGGPAGAVAIHLTHKAEDGTLWVQHFVSDTTDRDEGDVVSKIAEAVAKIAAEVTGDPDKFVETPGLRMFLENRVLDLGSSKRQQLVHHFHTVADALSSQPADSGAVDLD
ncbi:sce7725 family protein [Mycolicibacterium sp. PDY-3]|uniref:sce7725 family protein n=1 Tax=Mycolicibacterium sp. PDY-3 TaxID=3376069 RepID=UPI0037B36B9A